MNPASPASESLATQSCKPRNGDGDRLSEERVKAALAQLPGWQRSADGKDISKKFPFKNYHETMAFVNATAWVSHRQDHHPDLEVGYNACNVRYSTHSVGGLSDNDLICAAKIEVLFTL